MTFNVTDQQIADALKKYEPGFLPYPVFEQIARITALPILEIIPLRIGESGQPEVLLIERDNDDALWPGALHTPGTVIRATDNTSAEEGVWQPLARILHNELKDTRVGPVHHIGSMLHKSKRGVEHAQLYWVEVIDEPAIGTFYATAALPANIIESQVEFIHLAARKFLESSR